MNGEAIVRLLTETRSRVHSVHATLVETSGGVLPGAGRHAQPSAGARAADDADKRTWRCIWMADGRYRDEREAGKTLIFDGSTQWQIGKGGRSVMTTAQRLEPRLEVLVDPHWVVRDYSVEVTGRGETTGRPTLAVTATRNSGVRPTATSVAHELNLIVDEATGILLAMRSASEPAERALGDIRINEIPDESLLSYRPSPSEPVIQLGPGGAANVPWNMVPKLINEIRNMRLGG